MQTLHAPPVPVFREPARQLEVLDHADVLVLGGGPGGVGAALAAARAGARVVLVERFGAFGGTWTSGLLSSIMPYPHVKGVFHEIVTRLEKNGGWRCAGRDDPYDWRTKSHRAPTRRPHGWGGTYDAEKLKVVLDEMILEAGVVPYFFLVAAAVLRDRDQIRGVVVESKEGRRVITADLFIDATGDGDIAALAGVPVSAGRESDGEMQPMTMIFKMDGVDDAAATAACVDDPSLARAWQAAKRRGEVTVPRENVLLSPMPVPGQWVFNTTRIIGRDGTRVRDVSSAMIEGRRQVDEVARFLRRHIPGFAQARVSETAAHIGVRETRRVRCDYTITGEDLMRPVRFPDAVVRGNWAIDIHNPRGEGTDFRQLAEGAYFEIPYRSLCAHGIRNLLIASRCIDCTHEAHAAIRITPQVVAIGEAAGTAAAIAASSGTRCVRSLDIPSLQQSLRARGALV